MYIFNIEKDFGIRTSLGKLYYKIDFITPFTGRPAIRVNYEWNKELSKYQGVDTITIRK